MKLQACFVLGCFVLGAPFASAQDAGRDQKDIRAVLDDQVAAWNEKDLRRS